MKYQILVDQKFFDNWEKKFKLWSQNSDENGFNHDVEFLSTSIQNLLLNIDKNKVVTGKYCDIDESIFDGYINYLKNQIFKLLPLYEENGEWKKHLETIINEITGVDKIFLHSINFVSLLGKLESLKECNNLIHLSKKEFNNHPDFILFRKTIFESMNLSENLTVAGAR